MLVASLSLIILAPTVETNLRGAFGIGPAPVCRCPRSLTHRSAARGEQREPVARCSGKFDAT
jgi:hypothetical protein